MTQTTTKEKFLELLEPVYPRLSRYALAVTRNVEEAEDLTSDTILVALERFEKIQEDQFAGFLFKVASRLHKRKHYRERFRVPFNFVQAERLVDSSSTSDRSAEIAIVMDALERLPHKMKETLVLFEVADLPLGEIRQIQGGTLSGVKSRLKRGREQLQKLLDVEEVATSHRPDTSLKNLGIVLNEAREQYAV